MAGALADTLRRALLQGPPLRLALLFGSRARGQGHAGSDVDVGIVPARDLSLAEEGRLASALEAACGCPVDLVSLDSVSEALRWRAARDGVVLVSDPPHYAARWRARAGIEHADTAELREAALRRYRRRLAAGAP